MIPDEDNPHVWIKELQEAGWVKLKHTVWQSPEGGYYRGPYEAWRIMKNRSKPNDKSKVKWQEVRPVRKERGK
jgi:hypothetical protein